MESYLPVIDAFSRPSYSKDIPKMSSFIIEEVDSNDVPEEELREFVTTEEIPIVNDQAG